MNALEKVDVVGLYEVLSKGSNQEYKKALDQLQGLTSLMQAYRFIQQLQEFGAVHPEVKKVCMVCVQTEYNDEGLYDGAYFDAQIERKEGNQTYESALMGTFGAYNYDKIQQYMQKNGSFERQRALEGIQSVRVVSVGGTEGFKQYVKQVNAKLGKLFDKAFYSWATDPHVHSWVGEVIDMKNPMAVLEKVYDKQLVNYFIAQMQKGHLEQKTPQASGVQKVGSSNEAPEPQAVVGKKRTRKMGGAL